MTNQVVGSPWHNLPFVNTFYESSHCLSRVVEKGGKKKKKKPNLTVNVQATELPNPNTGTSRGRAGARRPRVFLGLVLSSCL